MTLIVSPETVARRLGIELPLSEDDQWAIEQAITAAQGKAEAYLNRPVVVREVVARGVEPPIETWLPPVTPVVEIVSAQAEMVGARWTGRYTVTYRAGLDAATDPGLELIRQFVIEDAMHSAGVQDRLRRSAPERARRVKSVSVTGQSATFEDAYAAGAAGSGAPGAPVTLESLARWKRRVAYQRRSRPGEPWPYGPAI